ncbi:MAG: chemotaxis protein [Anaerolinea sp.]|nr:chemotaxis protein [Anaerolinea sp.]
MTQKLAVAVIHGMGNQTEDFADAMITQINELCMPVTAHDVVIRPVHWTRVLQQEERTLWQRMQASGADLKLPLARRFLIDFLADIIAYQVTPHDSMVYDAVHTVLAETLRSLAEEAGERAPLCIIAHSLGSVIVSNYLYDLQHPHLIPARAQAVMQPTPLEQGDTLALLYMMGSPLALWSLRYRDFGTPIAFPPPAVHDYYPAVVPQWVNFYDPDDVAAFPLQALNTAYASVVTQDTRVQVGGVIEGKTPLAHLAYWTDEDVIRPIAEGLIGVWRAVNQAQS